jgi:hypothetical protein
MSTVSLAPNVAESLRLLRTYCGGYASVWALAGPQKRTCRKHVLEVLHGRKVKSTECGVNALRDALYAATGVTGGCEAERQQALFALANSH